MKWIVSIYYSIFVGKKCFPKIYTCVSVKLYWLGSWHRSLNAHNILFEYNFFTWIGNNILSLMFQLRKFEVIFDSVIFVTLCIQIEWLILLNLVPLHPFVHTYKFFLYKHTSYLHTKILSAKISLYKLVSKL